MAVRTIEGIEPLIKAFRTIPKIARAELANMIGHVANAVEGRARMLAPVDQGDLVRAIGQTGTGLNRKIGIEKGEVGGRTGQSSHTDPSIYGRMREFGTAKLPASPFMRPAADQEAAKWEGRIREVSKALEAKAAQAGGGRV
jgi:HK97 gp10 family phage protein